MRDDYTHISIVMDRSGSMNEVRDEAEKAINAFLTDQKEVDGQCSLTFVDFDGQDPRHVVFDGDIKNFQGYQLHPRGMTPLLDAVAFTIIDTGKKLEAMPEQDRPGKVIVVIQTDGEENASARFSWENVRDLVKEQTDVYGWQFIFLGMGLDTYKQGQAMGVQNVMSSDANNAATHDSVHAYVSHSTTAYRGGVTNDMSATRGMHTNSVGQMFNEAGEEIDPKTGKVKAKSDTTWKS